MSPSNSPPGTEPVLAAPADPVPPAGKAPEHSLLMSSALHRMAGALGLVLLLWLAVGWALAGTR